MRLFSHEYYSGMRQISILFLDIGISDGNVWFRLFGKGLRFADRSKHKALFSERNGYEKVIRIGKWSVKFLK